MCIILPEVVSLWLNIGTVHINNNILFYKSVIKNLRDQVDIVLRLYTYLRIQWTSRKFTDKVEYLYYW